MPGQLLDGNTHWRDRRLVLELATGAFLHQQRYEIADPAGLEPGVLFADEGIDSRGRNARELVNQSSLDVR